METIETLPGVVPQGDETQSRAEVLRQQIEIQQRLIKLKRECGIVAYRPHWKQHLFHSSTARRRGAFTGNRWGKSQMDAAETAAWMLGERSWYKTSFDILGVEHLDGKFRQRKVFGRHEGHENHPLVRQGIPPYATKQVVVCENWQKVERVWTGQDALRPGKIWQFLPKGWAKGYTNHAGVISEIHGKNGSVLYFVSVDAYKKDPLSVESEDYDRVVFDEPAPQGLWKGLARGLVDRQGQADFAMTSLSEVWIADKFEADPDAPVMEEDDRPFRDRFSLRGYMADNPHLTDEGIAEFENELTEDEKDCRLKGIPLERSGLVYKEFAKETHILKGTLPEGWKDWSTPAKNHILHIRVDTHPSKPNAVLFAAVGPSEIPICFDEIYKACDAETLCREIKRVVNRTGCFIGSLKMEPAAWVQDPVTRIASIAKVFYAHGLFPTKATKDLKTGILVTKSALQQKKVFFTEACRRTFWEFSRYRFDPETGMPVDEEDHMMENLYRLCITPTPWFDPDRASGEPITDEEFTYANTSTRDLDVNEI